MDDREVGVGNSFRLAGVTTVWVPTCGSRVSLKPGLATVTVPDCNCGSVVSRRFQMINRAVGQSSSIIAG